MPVVRNDSQIGESWTIPTFAAFLKGAFAETGMGTTPIDEFDADGWRILIWEKEFDATKTKGKAYYVLAFNSEGLRQAVIADYAGNGILPNEIQWSNDIGLNSFDPYEANAYRSTEAGLVILISPWTGQFYFLGWFRPDGKAVYWNENVAPFIFCSDFGSEWLSTELNPYQSEDGYGLNFGRFRLSFALEYGYGTNPLSSLDDIALGGILFINQGFWSGFVGATSTDWGILNKQRLAGFRVEVTGIGMFGILPRPNSDGGNMVALLGTGGDINAQYTTTQGNLINAPSSTTTPPPTPCQFEPEPCRFEPCEIELPDLSQICKWQPSPESVPTEGQLFPG